MADRYLTGRRVGLSVAALALIGLIVANYFCWFYPQTTVIVLRHAEKDTASNQPDDLVPLTQAGMARAATLAQVAERAGVSAIYVTQKLRTQQTAEPLAASSGVTPVQLSAADTDGLIDAVLSSGNRGGVIVIVGHSDTVPLIIDRLGGGAVTVGEEFDNLFVLTLNRWRQTKLIRATYGAPR